MTKKSFFKDQSFYVVGLGKSGLSTLEGLKKEGALLYAYDDDTTHKAAVKKLGIPWTLPGKAPWENLNALILSPGIPHHLPKPHLSATLAKTYNVPILCDIDLFFQMHLDKTIAGITGSHGKSTTTALTAHILETAKMSSAAGGNLGIPAFDLPQKEAYIMELSSFQLERIFTPALKGAIFLNISPNHLDRHGDMVHYQQAKLHIFDLLKPHGKKIIGVDDPLMEAIYKSLDDAYTIPVSGRQHLQTGVYVDRGWLVDHLGALPKEVLDLSMVPALAGAHNHQNIAASYALARALFDISPEVCVKAIETYISLPHRQELIGKRGSLAFINDSKATTLEAATKSLSAFKKIYWIVGGEPKENSVEIEPIRPFFSHIEQVYTIGASTKAYYDLLKDSLPVHKMTTLSKAFARAVKDAEASGKRATILLAPACASYDQYKNFEERGNHFRELVDKLLKKKAKK